ELFAGQGASMDLTSDEVQALARDWSRERADVDTSTLAVFLPLRRALLDADRRRARLLARYQLTPATLDILVGLRRVGKPYVRTPSELARSLVVSAGGISQRLERMERDALIERTVNQQDRRVVLVQLTDKGFRVTDELIGDYMVHEESLLHRLSGEERS